MAINKTKLFAFLGLVGGAFLLFSSFAGSKTEVPGGEDPNNDINNHDQGEPLPDDPAITGNQDSPTYQIGSRFYATRIVKDPKYIKAHPNDRIVPVALQMRNITQLKKGWYGEIEISAPRYQSIANFFAAHCAIADIYVSNGIQYLQTDYFINLDNPQHLSNLLKASNQAIASTWSIDFKILDWVKPVINITVPGVSLPILRIVAAYKYNNGVKVYIVGHSFVVVRDQNYLLNSVQPGNLIKLDQTVNVAYNNKTVKVASIGERNPTTSERIIEVELGYQGENSGGQVLIINQ